MFDKKKVFLMVAGGVIGATVGFATVGARRKQGALMPTVVGGLAGAATLAIGDGMMTKQPA